MEVIFQDRIATGSIQARKIADEIGWGIVAADHIDQGATLIEENPLLSSYSFAHYHPVSLNNLMASSIYLIV